MGRQGPQVNTDLRLRHGGGMNGEKSKMKHQGEADTGKERETVQGKVE